MHKLTSLSTILGQLEIRGTISSIPFQLTYKTEYNTLSYNTKPLTLALLLIVQLPCVALYIILVTNKNEQVYLCNAQIEKM